MIERLEISGGTVGYVPLSRAAEPDRLTRLPYVVRVFLENVLRRAEDEGPHVDLLATWPEGETREFPFHPGRVVLQDFTGVPVVADLAAMRAAVARLDGDPSRVNPRIPGDLVIDHSVIVDFFRPPDAFARNVEMEYERNGERYAFLRWAQQAFHDFRVVPPGAGIVHQVNLEYLAPVVMTSETAEGPVAYPDTLVGTDSHTTMIGGLGVLGWGVGGIEAEVALLGEPVALLTPEVVGFRLTGELQEGITATDLVLVVTEQLRRHGVVGKFVEFFGPGLDALTVPDRATIANMSPEYGATEGVFPIDRQTLTYLRGTGRDPDLVDLVERYARVQGLFHETGDPDPTYSEILELDLGSLEPSLAGPKRPQDRVPLAAVKPTFRTALADLRTPASTGAGRGESPAEHVEEALVPELRRVPVSMDGGTEELADGSVVIAAITSCTNTSNPSVMVAAGLLARNAVERGLAVRPTVKTSMAPGSPVVVDYLRNAGLLEPLEQLGFGVVGFGCTTCIGNSGPLPDPVAEAIDEHGLSCVAVLSGNRNFEGRIHPQVRMSFLASPPLCVAYALAGTTDLDLAEEPLGLDRDGAPVHLRDLWPSTEEVTEVVASSMDPEAFRQRYARIFDGDDRWRSLPVPEGDLYEWEPSSTYLTEPPFVADIGLDPDPVSDISDARVLVSVGETVTTDHISPAGAIPADSPAGRWLQERGVDRRKLHSYGARRGHHDVMVRGTFGNIRLRNLLAPGTEGGSTLHLPDGEETSIYEASVRYAEEEVPLLVLAGHEYGAGSSRDWAAKGTALLGIRAVIAQSYERIHRSNLAQMGVLPLQFLEGESRESLGLDGRETYDVEGVAEVTPGATLPVVARRDDGTEVRFQVRARLDTPTEVRYFREGGILPAVVRELARA
jgi:aconitate hydratase